MIDQDWKRFLAISYLLATALLFNRIRLRLLWIASAAKGLRRPERWTRRFADPVRIIGTANYVISIAILAGHLIASSPFWDRLFPIMAAFFFFSTIAQCFYLQSKAE